MAAPTLQLGYDDFKAEVGWYLGYGRGSINADQTSDVDRIIQEGLRRFYFPPPIPGEATGWSWSFLKPVASLTLQAPYSTGTVSSVGTTVTLAGSTWPSWMGTVGGTSSNAVLTVLGVDYTVASIDTTTTLTLDNAPGTAFPAATTYTAGQWDYTLPENFGAMEGDLTFMQDNSTYQAVPVTSESHIRKLRSSRGVGYGDSWPRYAALRPTAATTTAHQAGGVAQRYELMVWPKPEKIYHLEYKYMVILDKLSGTLEPMGGAAHSSTIMASCLAVAEEQRSKVEKVGISQQASFMRLLGASVAFDRRSITPETLGYNRDQSDRIHADGPWENQHRRANLLNVSQSGTTYFN